MAPPLSPGVTFAALLTLYFASAALAKPPCPLWGHMYPKPGIGALSTHPAIQQASQSLSALFRQHLDGTEGGGGGGGGSSASYSYAIEVFSADGGDEAPLLWSRYWTAPRLPEQDAAGVGVKTVASDTVFRIGSVTKVFTVLALLAVAGDAVWNDPITKYVPELAARVEETAGVPAESTWSPDWEDVTIGALAGQTSGIMRDCQFLFFFLLFCVVVVAMVWAPLENNADLDVVRQRRVAVRANLGRARQAREPRALGLPSFEQFQDATVRDRAAVYQRA